MIGHIFKKDLRRLWPFVVGAAVTEFSFAIIRVALSQFPWDAGTWGPAQDSVGDVTDLLIFFVIAMAVQLDPIPGNRQDWLVRPVKRWDLLFGKLLFVIVLIHGPMLAIDILQGLATGFPFGQTLVAASSRNIYLFVTLSLPTMAIAALTRNIAQVLALGLAVFVCALASVGMIPAISAIYTQNGIVADSEHSLTSFVLKIAVILAGAVAILGLQYFRRATTRGRIILGLAAVLALASQLLPQEAAFALQSWLPGNPGHAVSISFAPDAGKPQSVMQKEEAANSARPGTLIYLPFRVEGLPPGLMLTVNPTAFIIAADGTTVKAESGGKLIGLPDQSNGTTQYYQVLTVPSDFLRAHGTQPVRVEFQFVLGFLRPQGSYELPAVGGNVLIPEVGRCKTENNNDRLLFLHCVQDGEMRMYVSAALIDRASGLRNPSRTISAAQNDAPYRSGADMIKQFEGVLPLGASDIDAQDPVGASQLAVSVVSVTVSQPLAHIVRRVTIPDLRLSEWKSAGASTTP